MISRNVLLFLCRLLIFLLGINTRLSNAMLLWTSCGNDNITTSGNYSSNLNFLLSTLSSNASQPSTNGFYNIISESDPSNTVYGLFLCRGDVTTDVCGQCVANASGEIINRCPNQKTAIIWFDECMLRYSNVSMFSRVEEYIKIYYWNTQNVTDLKKFNQKLGDLMGKIASRAANDRSGKKFAVEEADYSPFQRKIYALGQCTPDVSNDDCENCLRNATKEIPLCCNNRQGGRVLNPTCNIRFEVYPFYNPVTAPPAPAANLPPPPPPPFPPTPTSSKVSPADSPRPALGHSRREKSNWKLKLPIGVVAAFLAALTVLSLYCMLRRKIGGLGDGDKGDDKSLVFSFTSIESATDHFSEAKKLGEGGFGPVYKGKLDNGLEVAVKRLNRMTAYGIEQFRNEVTVISKLQHRNLVRLLGYCTHREERILIYEYLPNKSLDSILFDEAKRYVLDWKGRLKIIEGIAQGLLYLHKYSRVKIIHRDLKPSNILLDNDMNPKISDFGTARIFGENEMRANTNKIVGTYGYMSPEYAMDGIFSEKSDVFSFGVMILEIIAGKKNTAFYESDRHLNLIGHVWDLWLEGSITEITDSSLNETISKPEVLKYVQVGLLCVQEKGADRPTMSDVVSMLFNESMAIASPKRPAFSEFTSLSNANLPENPEYCSVNKVTISDVEGR